MLDLVNLVMSLPKMVLCLLTESLSETVMEQFLREQAVFSLIRTEYAI
jgi:hypothetical protein